MLRVENAFVALSNAIKQENKAQILTILTEKPEVLLLANAAGQTLFHVALLLNKTEMLQILFQVLQQNYPAQDCYKILTARDKYGFTILHLAAQSYSFDVVKLIVEALEPNAHLAAKLMVLEKLPIDFVEENRCSKTEKLQMMKLLEIAMFSEPLKSMEKPSDFAEVLDRYKKAAATNDRVLIELLFINLAVNMARRIAQFTTSHASICKSDKMSLVDFNNLKKYGEQVRHHYNGLNANVAPNQFSTRDSFSLKLLENIVAVVKKFKFANCEELCYLVLFLLIQFGIKTPIEIYQTNCSSMYYSSGHAILIMGRDKATDPYNYKTWNPGTWVIDPLLGEIYPASLIPEKLKTFIFYVNRGTKNWASLSLPFDEERHELMPYSEILLSQAFFKNNKSNFKDVTFQHQDLQEIIKGNKLLNEFKLLNSKLGIKFHPFFTQFFAPHLDSFTKCKDATEVNPYGPGAIVQFTK